ncbi:hypothetical protein BOX15_Mlig024180g2 [Macrostomum lignano]|nr:hypothetical protein BOX15_Mlig024180g2 [Macrostomum lignano]
MEPTFALEVGTRSLSRLPNFRQVSLPSGRALLYRSGYVERLSAEGVDELRNRYGIRCIFDLRGARELRRTLPGSHVARQYRHLLLAKDGSQRPLENELGENEDETEEAEKGRRYTVDFLGRYFFYSMFMKLPVGSKLTIGWALITSLYSGDRSYEARAAQIVLAPRGLTGQSRDFIDFCQAELAAVLRLMTRQENLPCLVHCFLGKDRTGLIAMLLQWLLGTPRQVIEDEYQLSQTMTEEVRGEAVKYYAEKSLPASFAECNVEELRAAMEYIETKYGGVESYLRTTGLSQQELDLLRRNFGSESSNEELPTDSNSKSS